MSKDLELRLKLTATDKNVAGTVRNTKKEVQGLSGALGTTTTASRGTASGMSAITTAGDEATRMFKLQKGSLQQAGYQFQDLAAQIGSGTSAFVSMGQQLPQLLSLLGPGGAILGAIAAVSSIVGGVLYNSLVDTSDQVDVLKESLENLETILTKTQGGALILAEEILELAEASQTAAKLQIAQGVLEAESAINASVARTKQILEGSLGNFTIDFSEALAQIDSLEAKGKSLTNLLNVSERVGTPGSILGINFVQDELEELREDFGVAREDGIRFFQSLARAQRDPSTENLKVLQETVADIGLALRETSPEFVTLANALAKQARETGNAVEAKKELEQALENVNGALERSRKQNDETRKSQESLIASTEDQIAFLERQTSLIQAGITVKAAAREAEREGLRQELLVAGFAEERIDQLYRLQDAVRNAAEAEKQAADARAEAQRKAAQAQRESIAAQRDYENSVTSLVNALDPLGAEFEAAYQNQQLLIRAAQDGLITADQRDFLIGNLVTGLSDAGEEGGKELAEKLEAQAARAADRVATSLQTAITTGDWDGVGATVGGALAGAIGGMVTETLMEQMAGQAGASIFGPIAGAIAGGLAGLAVNAVADYFGDDWDPTAARQAAQGTGTVLGDINAKSESIRRAVEGAEGGIGQLVGINQGMLRALQNLQSGISGASDRIARGRGGVSIRSPGAMSGHDLFDNATSGVMPLFDETLGAAFDFFDAMGEILTFGLLDLGSVIGGKSKKRDEGIQIVGGYISDLIDETIVNAYATFRVKKHAFDDYDTKERFSRIGGDVERQFSAVFESLLDSVLSGADVLGLDVSNRLGDFRVSDQKISLEGLSADEQRQELEAYFGTVFDNLAGHTIPWLEEFQNAGEGLGETLARVANQTAVTQEVVDRLGIQFSDLAGKDLVQASEHLVEAAGGVEQFITSMESFIGNFATEAQQFALAGSDLTRALEQQSLAVPKTREGYYQLLQAQDGATESGAETIATLLRLQGVADKYYTLLEDYQDEALRSQQDLVRDRLGAAERAARSVTDAIESLTVQTEQFSQMQRQSSLQTLRDMANSGVVRPGDDLDRALSAATNINASNFGSLQDYIREVAVTGNVLADLDQITQEQVTVEQRMLDSLERQNAILEEGNAAQIQAIADLQSSVDRNTAVAVGPAPSTSTSSAQVAGSAASNSALLSEVRSMKAQLQESQRSIAKHTAKAARLLERFEIDGIEVRE